MANKQQTDLQKKIANAKAKTGAEPVETPPVETPPVETPPVETPPVETPVKKQTAKKEEKKVEVKIYNTSGKEVPTDDYFFKGVVPTGFTGTCGNHVTREDLLTVFNKVFKPADNILFYRQADKEVYLVIVPLKYSISVGDFEDSTDGDFQKHAISFLNEGSVNLDTLRQKLERVTKFVKYDDR